MGPQMEPDRDDAGVRRNYSYGHQSVVQLLKRLTIRADRLVPTSP